MANRKMVVEPETDAGLVARVARGDEAAFRTLYRRHTPRIFQLLLRLTGGRQLDAEDLVQETWLRAVKRLPVFRGDANLSAWLRGIGLNVWREWMRSAVVDDARQVDLEPDDLAEAAPVIPDSLDLDAAVATLPPRQRAVLVLHDIEGYTHEEIAAQLGIVQGTS
jgi:RNA polymerase sigma-70 factor (ECF subfamily)